MGLGALSPITSSHPSLGGGWSLTHSEYLLWDSDPSPPSHTLPFPSFPFSPPPSIALFLLGSPSPFPFCFTVSAFPLHPHLFSSFLLFHSEDCSSQHLPCLEGSLGPDRKLPRSPAWPHLSVCPTDWCVIGLFQHSGINSSDAEVLTLFNVTEAQSGEYVCKVSNYIGEANQSAWLTVTRPVAKGNGEMDGALYRVLDLGPTLLGQVGKSALPPTAFLMPRAMEKSLAWGAWFGLVLCASLCALWICGVCVCVCTCAYHGLV